MSPLPVPAPPAAKYAAALSSATCTSAGTDAPLAFIRAVMYWCASWMYSLPFFGGVLYRLIQVPQPSKLSVGEKPAGHWLVWFLYQPCVYVQPRVVIGVLTYSSSDPMYSLTLTCTVELLVET